MAETHAPAATSPLATIRDKERALAQAIQAAKAQANARLAEARTRAEAIRAQAERNGVREAETLYQEGLARARADADALRAKGETDAAALRDAGRPRIAQAVEQIVQFVLPRVDDK